MTMPEQRDLRVDLKHVASIDFMAHSGPMSLRLADHLGEELLPIATHALERAIVAEDAVDALVVVLSVLVDRVCSWCPEGDKCKTDYDPDSVSSCFRDAFLTQARAKVGL